MTSTEVRYSTANVGQSAPAQSFSWEAPVPVNRFWDTISYCISRNFLDNFSDSELGDLPIDPESNATNEEKFHLLLQLLHEKLGKEEAAADPTPLYELDYKRWNSLWQAIYVFQNELGLPETEATLRILVEKADKSNVVPRHSTILPVSCLFTALFTA